MPAEREKEAFMPTLCRKYINLRFFMIKRPTLSPSTTNNTTKTTNCGGNEDEGFVQSIPQTTTSSATSSDDNTNIMTDSGLPQPATHKDPHLTSATATSTSTTINEYEDNNDDMDMDTISILGSTTPDFTIIYASDRFFFSCPGRSNSIIDSSSPTPYSSSTATAGPTGSSSHAASSYSSSSYSAPKEETTFTTASVEAVQTFSPDPYLDFRRSMKEVVEAYGLDDVEVRESWNSLHELLLCYLRLNPEETHKFIAEAFSDMLVELVVEQEADQSGASNHTRG